MHRFLWEVISLMVIRKLCQMQQENLLSPATVKSPEAFTDRTYSGLETNTPKFSKVKTPAKARCDCFLKQLNSKRHDESLTDLFLQDR